MDTNGEYYIINPNWEPTEHEVYVRDVLGFDYVSTTNLGIGGVLGMHSHGSHNVHYIVDGAIIITKFCGSMELREQGSRKLGNKIEVDADVWYKGKAEGGCIFVEGHRRLSLDTARRFAQAGREQLLLVKAGTEGILELTPRRHQAVHPH